MRALLTLAAAATAVRAFTFLPGNSFEPPFTQFDGEGNRKIPGYSYGGTAALQETFLRLAKDRQSQKGWLWGSDQVGAPEWSATLRFRISGQGKRLFGDGLGIWATTSQRYRDGGLHGMHPVFAGFGIVVDTYVNSEPGHVHKDVVFISSDGSSSKEAAAPHGGGTDANVVGCDASGLRYYEGRGDFSPFNHSALRIRYKDNSVSVWVDPKADGNWRVCFENAPVAAPAGWDREGVWLGLTATTGDLADNHDVLSLQVGLEDEAAPAPAILRPAGAAVPQAVSTGNAELDAAIRVTAARESAALMEKMTELQHKLEHAMTALQDGVKTSMKKIGDAEAENKKRIEELERRLNAAMNEKVSASVENRLEKLEGVLSANIEGRLNREVLPSLEASTRSWTTPFYALAGLLVLVAVYAVWVQLGVQRAMKRHLL